MAPIFARPKRVFRPRSRAAFIALLDQFGVPYEKWEDSETKLTKLWKEVCRGDTVYTTGIPFGQPFSLVRFLITIAVRVVMIHPELGVLVLVEFVRNGDYYRPRKYANSTQSEKGVLSLQGLLTERPIDVVRRCLSEETNIEVSRKDLRAGLQFTPYTSLVPLIGAAKHVEQDFHEKILKTQGLWNFNQVAHYVAYLPEECYFLGWRKDTATRYLSCWRSASETSTQFEDPIPVELVL